MKKYLSLIIAVMLLSMTACTSQPPSESGQIELKNENASGGTNSSENGLMSNFTATELNGDAIDETIFSDYDLTMVNVWATFCGPCLQEMPDLGELSNEYQSKGVQIVGMISDVLNSDGSISQSQVDTAKDIVSSTKANYLHILPSEDLFGLISQITSVPTTFFVDKDGNQVGGVYVGSKSKAEWQSIIDRTLAEVAK